MVFFIFIWYAQNRREAPSAPPLGELLSVSEAEGVRYEIWERYENTHDTLSVSPFGLPALPVGEPRALRANRRALPAIAFKKTYIDI